MTLQLEQAGVAVRGLAPLLGRSRGPAAQRETFRTRRSEPAARFGDWRARGGER